MIKDKIDKIIEELKTVKKEKITDFHFFDTESYKCYLNNGQEILRERLIKGECDGSASVILPLTVDNKVVVCIEPRVFTDTTVSVDLPAGYIEKDETAEDAAKRELLEETGYTCGELKHLGRFYQDHGISSACNHYYLALNCYKVSEQKLDEDEFVKQLEVTIEELFYLLDNGYMKSINSAYIIEKCRPYLERINNEKN